MRLAVVFFLLFIVTATNSPSQTASTSSSTPPTAQQVIARIKTHVGVPWQNETVDTFKAGNPDTAVTGVAVTMMATMDVLQRAVASGDNLIITHEPTFYSHLDKPDNLPMKENDPVLADKRAYIEKHHLVIWRFHDHWHQHNPDGIEAGLLRELGWEQYEDPKQRFYFTIPQTSLADLAAFLQKRLGVANIRVVGNREIKITHVALSPGASGSPAEIGALENPDVQVLILGETREWETVEYVVDAISEGKQKALIILSHVPSEQAGMEECVRWMKTFVSEVPVEFVPAPDPFAGHSTLLR